MSGFVIDLVRNKVMPISWDCFSWIHSCRTISNYSGENYSYGYSDKVRELVPFVLFSPRWLSRASYIARPRVITVGISSCCCPQGRFGLYVWKWTVFSWQMAWQCMWRQCTCCWRPRLEKKVKEELPGRWLCLLVPLSILLLLKSSISKSGVSGLLLALHFILACLYVCRGHCLLLLMKINCCLTHPSFEQAEYCWLCMS